MNDQTNMQGQAESHELGAMERRWGGVDTGAATLWASAFVVLAMIITQVGRFSSGDAAMADAVSRGDVTVVTAGAQNNEEILLVLDSRSEVLAVYGVENQRNLRQYQAEDVARMFENATRSNR